MSRRKAGMLGACINDTWCCSLFAPIAHSSSQNLLTLHLAGYHSNFDARLLGPRAGGAFVPLSPSCLSPGWKPSRTAIRYASAHQGAGGGMQKTVGRSLMRL